MAPLHDEPHQPGQAGRLNWLRAGVLGANDGIVSVAGLVIGVAGATSGRGPIFTAGMAGIVAGAVSMALGEYVSVSSQRDSESALLDKERRELAEEPDAELHELTMIYRSKGLSQTTAHQVAVELTAQDPLGAHAEAELHLNPNELASPTHAGLASATAFLLGSLLPFLSILLLPSGIRVPITFLAVLVALAITGGLSARIGGSSVRRAVIRIVAGGAAGMALTYGIGAMFGTAIA
ncbi:hypothetical protein C6I20_06740 [Aeromicrobium sp. A1-2]|nr:hypothetical protein C6I20_06740 [Aeromicrobium sp. A1-2]